MGFDIECIINIQTYPGEYFCPVCRTLVYPSEAFQTQCRHLYCKPCLEYIANGSKTCPYDEFMVTESDSKPLMDSDKALAENIGKVKVRCLYFRSGCPWEGPLSDCTAHCSGCTFGNSPVICNRCGIQIVHRQVHDHAKSCLGTHEGQQAAGDVSSVAKSGTISSTADVNHQAAVQSGAPVSQAQNPQNAPAATPLPGQNNVQPQGSAAFQSPAVAPVAAAPTHEQWYQQQYQQYYQQYAAGYDPYQQPNQQYCSLQQQPVQQYQQHPAQVHGQYQSHVYTQPQQQSYPVPQAPQQPYTPQAQAQGQAHTLPQAQPNVALQSQGQAQAQAQLYAPPNQTSVLNYQTNPQQQTHPQFRPHTQIPPQTLPPPPPQTQPTHPQQPYGPPNQTVGLRPTSQHNQYQQPPPMQMHYPQPPQAHSQQPQMQSQPQAQVLTQPAQSTSQLHGQIQPQPQAQPYLTQSQPQPPVFPQVNNQSAPAALPQAPHQPVPPVSGHQSYINPQLPQKMHTGVPQQPPMNPQSASGSQHPIQLHGQMPQQHAQMQPPIHGSVPQHPPTMLAPQNHQFPPYPQHRPLTQPAVQPLPQNYTQQQQPLFFHQTGHLMPQQSMQMQMHPSGPPPGPQPQNFVGRPLMPNQGIHSQNHPYPPNQVGGSNHPGPAQLPSAQTPVNQNNAKSTVLEPNATTQETISSSKVVVEKVGEPLNEEKVVAGQNGVVVKDRESDAGVNKSIKQDENHVQGAVEQATDGKSFEDGAGEVGLKKEGKESDLLKQMDLENQKSMSANEVGTGPSSTNLVEQPHTALPASGAEGHMLPPHAHGSQQQRPQGPLLSTEERVSGNFGPPNNFKRQPDSQGPGLTDQRGIMGRAPPLHLEGYGPQHVGRSSEVPNDHLSGAGERAFFSKTRADELSSFRMNGYAAADPSISGSRDEQKALSRDPLNPFPREPMHNVDPAARSFDKTAPRGPMYDAVPNFGHPHRPSGVHGHADVFGPGHEFDQHRMNHFSRGSPHRNYRGSSSHGFGGRSSFPRGTSGFDDTKFREARRFGEGSQPFNHPSDPAGIPFHDGRMPPMSGPMRRGDLDGPRNSRFGEHVAPGHFHMNDPAGPGAFSGRGHAGEFGGPGNFLRLPFNESVRGGSPNFSHFGEPPMMNNYSGFHGGGSFTGGMDSFDQSRKRKHISCGWCRICEIDCQSLEGLDLHSQTREHQNMAMDIVKRIKLQNKRHQRNNAGRKMNEGGSRSRKMSMPGR